MFDSQHDPKHLHNLQQDIDTDDTSHKDQSKRAPGSGIYGILRKTKNKTYSTFRGNSVPLPKSPDRRGNFSIGESQSNNNSKTLVKSTRKKRRTDYDSGEFSKPSSSYISAWDKDRIISSFTNSPCKINQIKSFGVTNPCTTEDVVGGIESIVRKMVIFCAIFIAGTKMPELAGPIQKVLSLFFTVWGTCLVIIGLAWLQNISLQNNDQPKEPTDYFRGSLEYISVSEKAKAKETPLSPPKLERLLSNETPSKKVLQKKSPQFELNRKRSYDDIELVTNENKQPQNLFRQNSSFMPEHLKQLEDLYIMMDGCQQRISPNGVAVNIENDLFHGKMLLMFRTGGVDEPPVHGVAEDPYVTYFRGKQRRFEFQWQLQLKQIPSGDVYLGCELDEPISMGMIQRALVNGALKFVKKMNVGFSFYISDSSDTPSYLSFPLASSMDRFVATKPGNPMPQLGGEIIEDPDAIKRRRKGTKLEWNTNDTYTMALWSAYFDWIDWKILNFPGIRPFSATSVAGVQPIKLTVYTLSKENEKELAGRNFERNLMISLEVSNSLMASLGSEAKIWKMKDSSSLSSQVLQYTKEGCSVNEVIDEDLEDYNTEYDDDDIGDLDDAEIDILDINDAFALDQNQYVCSGSPLSLREGLGSFVTSGKGFAVLQSVKTSSILLEKIFRSKKPFSYLNKSGVMSDLPIVIRNGDIVRVKLVDPLTNVMRYLSIHRGWWLKWSSNRPKKNGSFYVRTNESNSAPLFYGDPFSLESRKWHNYFVGVCIESSAKFGGRMLAIYKAGKSAIDSELPPGCDEEEDPVEEDDKDLLVDKTVSKRIAALYLCAESIQSTDAKISSPVKSPSNRASSANEQMLDNVKSSVPGFNKLQFELKVPVWLEVMNRTTRAKQLVYAISAKEMVCKSKSQINLESIDQNAVSQPINTADASTTSVAPLCNVNLNSNIVDVCRNIFLKLRSGRDLAPFLNQWLQNKDELTSDEQILQITNLQVSDEEGEKKQHSTSFDYSNQGTLQHTTSYSSSSDESESNDEILEEGLSQILIAGSSIPCIKDPFSSESIDGCSTIFHGDDCLGIIAEPEIENATTACSSTPPSQSCSQQDLTVLEAIEKAQKKSFVENPMLANDEITRKSRTSSANTSPASEARLTTPIFSNTHVKDDLVNDILIVPKLEQIENNETKKKNKTKHTAVFNRVAKSVKSSTAITGKQMIKQSKKVVNTGRAAGRVIPVSSVVYPIAPRKHEPGGMFSGRKASKKESMRMIGRAIKNMEGQYDSHIASDQLQAPDLNKERLSQILSQMSMSKSPPILEMLSLFINTNSSQDLAFLRGGQAELGVIPIRPIDVQFDYECLCARGIWEGHWREELCVLYTREKHIAFYSPLSRKPSLVASFEEIITLRKCDPVLENSPLPGLHLISIDTVWRCHYIAFLTEEVRDVFLKRTNDALFLSEYKYLPQPTRKVAHEWECFEMSLETSLSGNAGKWIPVSLGKKSKHNSQRRIFNGRRMTFDLKSFTVQEKECKDINIQTKIARHVEELLRTALSLSPEVLSTTDSKFINFLDEVSRLQSLPLHEIDLHSKDALCIFVNLYHCLLQHALLFAVDGLPDKRSITHFKRCSCYEIGKDVFSLSELECCVIRGKMSKATNIKSPFVEAAKKSRSYLKYALEATDYHINFILNNGCMDYPSEVPIFQSKTLENQIDTASSKFLKDQVQINVQKRQVILPKVCDVYCNDFGIGDDIMSLSPIIRFLDKNDQQKITEALDDGGQITVKTKQSCEKFHSTLRLLR